jgi:redox-sensitive bicupin YhaK (pirin superfamily)
MTAGAGILHEEFHSAAFTRSGGELKMIQLWVNLPAKDKMTAPGYQSITAGTIPTVALANGADRFGLLPASMTTSAARPYLLTA